MLTDLVKTISDRGDSLFLESNQPSTYKVQKAQTPVDVRRVGAVFLESFEP